MNEKHLSLWRHRKHGSFVEAVRLCAALSMSFSFNLFIYLVFFSVFFVSNVRFESVYWVELLCTCTYTVCESEWRMFYDLVILLVVEITGARTKSENRKFSVGATRIALSHSLANAALSTLLHLIGIDFMRWKFSHRSNQWMGIKCIDWVVNWLRKLFEWRNAREKEGRVWDEENILKSIR